VRDESKIMKDQNIKVQIDSLSLILRDEINRESDPYRSCRLQDAQEYLRRAWHAIDDSPCADNDTTIELQRFTARDRKAAI
jgi:hypothetical protein